METIPQHELEEEVDDMIDFYDHLAFEAMNRIVNLLRKEEV